jgi:hypothetical protein
MQIATKLKTLTNVPSLTTNKMFIMKYLSVIAVGPIKECRKFAEEALWKMDKNGYARRSTVFANFNVKNNGDNSTENPITENNNESENEINLQRICAEKVKLIPLPQPSIQLMIN